MIIPKKSLGQNFLLDRNICKKISNLITIKNKIVYEIGPGTGQLTQEIIKKNPKKLIIIEKDKDLYHLLKNKFLNIGNLEIINMDVENYNFNLHKKINIISNLPYNISIKFIYNCLLHDKNINEMLLMVQREVAIKMQYKISLKKNKYNFLMHTLAEFKIITSISNHVFYPKPKIQSSLILIKPKINNIDINRLYHFAEKIFMHKRKKIRNIITFNKKDSKIERLIEQRAEDLSHENLLELFNIF